MGEGEFEPEYEEIECWCSDKLGNSKLVKVKVRKFPEIDLSWAREAGRRNAEQILKILKGKSIEKK